MQNQKIEFSCAVAVAIKGLIPINGDTIKMPVKNKGRRIFL